jgi:hypothetical protein
MIIFVTAAIMLTCAGFYYREGLFTAICMAINVFLAGLIAFNFFEPLSNKVEALTDRTWMQGLEDFVCLIGLFCASFGLLRALTNKLNNEEITLQPTVNSLGAAAVGLAMGYLLAGFLVTAMETLPWHRNFLDFELHGENESGMRSVLPPDRVWLALMHRAGATCLSRGDNAPTFDAEGTFESYYSRFRRYDDGPNAGQK